MTNNEKGKDLTTAVDKREWLAERGLAKAGTRGKFSNAAKEALAEAEKNGILFLDKNVKVGTVTVINENGDRVQEKREVNIFAPHPEPIRQNERYLFVGKDKNGKRIERSVAVTEICASCSYSLGWCYEQVPTFRDWKSGEVLSLVS